MKIFFIILLFIFFFTNNFIFAKPNIIDSSYTYKLLETDLIYPSGVTEKEGSLLISDLGDGTIYQYNNNDSKKEIFYDGLPFGLDIMGYPTGPYKIKFQNDKLYISQGWADIDRLEEHIYDHSLLKLDKNINIITNDLWNPYDFSFHKSNIYLIDSGKNKLIKIDENNNFHEILFFDKIIQKQENLNNLSPTEFSKNKPYLIDSVPTGIAINDLGTIYVCIFSGFPYFKGSGKILKIKDKKINKEKEVSVLLENLNAPIDVEVLNDGRLAILEMGSFDYEKEFAQNDGRLLIYNFKKKNLDVIIDNLDRPMTILQRLNGNIIVTELSGKIYNIYINK